jgi:hypothetical protein
VEILRWLIVCSVPNAGTIYSTALDAIEYLTDKGLESDEDYPVDETNSAVTCGFNEDLAKVCVAVIGNIRLVD